MKEKGSDKSGLIVMTMMTMTMTMTMMMTTMITKEKGADQSGH